MRARGANVTDIAVLVVAADDGVMPQTEEAISHAKAAGVPIIVAMNKIDLPGANPDRVLQQLATHELMPSQWGGDVEVVQTSAINGTGLDDLLETILTTAELYEFKANPNRPAVGTCLESQQDPDRGVLAKVVVQNGTLRVGDIVLCGCSYGRVKAMYDTLKPNQRVEAAGPSQPVNITGLDRAPDAGEKLWVVDDISKARSIAAQREAYLRDQSLSGITKRVSLEEFQQRLEAGDLAGAQKEVVTLNLVLRADARGSIEAIRKELSKLTHPEVRIRILQALVGGVTVGDVRLAQASDAVIIGFNVVPDENARNLAEDLQVEIRRYEIIYKIADDIKATLEGKLKPEKQAVELGALLVLRTFNVSRMGTIAGCRVMRGSVQRGSRIRVIRDNRIVGDYGMESLRREKDDVKEVSKGMECGVKLEGFNDVKEGDMLEAYRIEEVARTL
jgi:translation initiation factor IF-2